MEKTIIELINKAFEPEFRESVIKELQSIEPKHVMAQSEYNLNNTRMSILYLAKGNIKQVIELTKCAKIDFRDVIYWADLEKKKNKKL